MIIVLKIRKSDGVVVGAHSCSDPSKMTPDSEEFFYRERPESLKDMGFGKKFKMISEGVFEEFTPLPTAREILTVRFNELAASDWTAVADRDPMPEWVKYRKALRDLTAEGKTVEAMVALFPIRPDGVDAIAHLRSRLHG